MSVGSSVAVLALWDCVLYTSIHTCIHWSLCDVCLTAFNVIFRKKTPKPEKNNTTQNKALDT